MRKDKIIAFRVTSKDYENLLNETKKNELNSLSKLFRCFIDKMYKWKKIRTAC